MSTVFTKQQWEENTKNAKTEIKQLEDIVSSLEILIELNEKYELDYSRYKRYLNHEREVLMILDTFQRTFRDKDEITIL